MVVQATVHTQAHKHSNTQNLRHTCTQTKSPLPKQKNNHINWSFLKTFHSV